MDSLFTGNSCIAGRHFCARIEYLVTLGVAGRKVIKLKRIAATMPHSDPFSIIKGLWLLGFLQRDIADEGQLIPLVLISLNHQHDPEDQRGQRYQS